MIHRPSVSRVVSFEGTEVHLDPSVAYDDADEFTARLVARYREFFDAPNIEAATSAPGERRSTRRPSK